MCLYLNFNNVSLALPSSVFQEESLVQVLPSLPVREANNGTLPTKTQQVYEKYRGIFTNFHPQTLQQITDQARIFFSSTIRSPVNILPIVDKENLIGLAYFANKSLLDLAKLPTPPLVFEGITLNGQPLQNFVVPPEEGSSADLTIFITLP